MDDDVMIGCAGELLAFALENGRQGLWAWTPNDDRLHFSRQWYALFGHAEGSITSLRRDLRHLLHPDDVDASLTALLPMLDSECTDFELEHRLRHADGHYLTVLARGRALEHDAAGRTTRVLGTHIDISQLKQAQARVLESRALLETVVDAFPQRVFWKDLDDRYLGCNRRFAADAGYAEPADLIGLPVSEIPWPTSFAPIRDDDRHLVEGGASKLVVRRPFRTVRGEEFWAETIKVPLRDAAGAVIGILGIYDDVTEQHVHEVQMRTVAEAFTSEHQVAPLESLVRAAAELAGADIVLVGRLEDEARQIRVVAGYPLGNAPPGLTYRLAESPCARTLEEGETFIGSGVAREFPAALRLSHWHIEGYAGRCLHDADGQVAGLIVLLFRQAGTDFKRVRTVVDMLAERAGAELERERVLSELRTSEQRLNTAIEHGGQHVWEWDIARNEFLIKGPHFAADRIRTGDDVQALHHPQDQARQREVLRAFLRGERELYDYEARMRLPDGSYRWMLIRAGAAKRDAAGRVMNMLGTVTDISALKAAQEESEASRQFLRLVIETVPQAIFWQDPGFRYRGCNQRFADFAGVDSPAALLGRSDEELWWARSAARFQTEDRRLIEGARTRVHAEYAVVLPDGQQRWFEAIKVPMHDADGAIIGILGAIHDVSTRKQAEQAAQRLASFDALTDLPNRRLFGTRLETALAAATRHARTGALLFLDLDQFKHINDTLGHAVGDTLLQKVALRLQQITRQEDTVARLGGDEFVVLLPDLAGDFEACARLVHGIAGKIHRAFGAPFAVDGHQLHVTPTIGVALFPEPGKSAADVLKQADTAMYSGKAAGRNVTRFFDRELEQAARQRARVEGALHDALARREFELVYQPQVDAAGVPTGAEVLLRWRDPTHGLLGPDDFIAIAEERGLIVDIGRWVMGAAFERYRAWLDQGLHGMADLALNLSSRQFRAGDFVADVERLLEYHDVSPHRVVFEISEGAIEDFEAARESMARLRGLGIRFALDDFGIGRSSLSCLTRLPIDRLKIDRSFIVGLGRDRDAEVICRTIVELGRQLGLDTVAEGIESRAQFELLTRMGCGGYQGYLFLPPAPEAEFLAFAHAARAAGEPAPSP